MPELLSLKSAQPVARGSTRLVFLHPGDPELLIKVFLPRAAQIWGGPVPWYRGSWRRHREYVLFNREVSEYLAGYAPFGGRSPFLEEIRGFVETDFGLGLVARAERNRQGDLAPTLSQLIARGQFDSAAEVRLNEFIDYVMKADIVVYDLKPANLVYGFDGTRDRFVLIDGLGDTSLFALKSLIRPLNRRAKKRRFARLRGYIAAALEASGPAALLDTA